MYAGRFGDLWFSLTVIMLLVSVMAQQPALLLVALLLLLTAGVSRLWERTCLARMEYTRTLSPRRAFIGEEVELQTRIVNRKLLPLAWLELEDETPSDVAFVGEDLPASHKPQRRLLRSLLSLRWYESVTRTYRVRCLKRGLHAFGPATLRSGDVFGFFDMERPAGHEDYLLVYPRVLPLERQSLPTRFLFGETRLQRSIIEDPLRLAGVRDYAAGDSLRRVHWRATARVGRMQVKQFEASTDLDLVLFLNIATMDPEWLGALPDVLESAVTVTASLATYALDKGFRVGLYANTNLIRSDQQVKVEPSREPGQRMRVLETLAQVNGLPTMAMDSFLRRETRSLPWGATVVVVSAVLSQGTLAALQRLRRAGRRVAVVQVGDESLAVPSGLACYRAVEGPNGELHLA